MNKILSYKQRIIDLCFSLKDKIVMDYGCGKGDFINLLLENTEKPKIIYAIDSSLDMINHIKQNFSSTLVKPMVCNDPKALTGLKFDRIICHNVLECIDNKLDFINRFSDILTPGGLAIISHYDFDSAIYNSSHKELTRDFVHQFSDTKQEWQNHSDGQIGRKIPGLIAASIFKDHAKIETWRLVEYDFQEGFYGFLMANMIKDVTQSKDVDEWINDLEAKHKNKDYYFAIDMVVAVLEQSK